jgi:hypothetical protein
MFEDNRAAVMRDIRNMYVFARDWRSRLHCVSRLARASAHQRAPFIDWRVRARPAAVQTLPWTVLPLVGTPSGKTSRAGPVLWKTVGAMGPFKDHNRYIVESARLWVVATTEDQLVAVQSRFAPATEVKSEAAKPPTIAESRRWE